VPYIAPKDCRAAIEPLTLAALFDDAEAGRVADENEALLLAIEQAHAETTSNLAVIYDNQVPTELPEQVSSLLRTAELAYFKFFAYDRKPALAMKISTTYLQDLWDRAEKRMDRVKEATQTIAPNDSPPPAPPANIGGITHNSGPRVSIDDVNGNSTLGDF